MKNSRFFLSVLVLFAFALSAAFPAFAADTADADSSAKLECKFYSSSGEEVDGNSLSPGEYSADIVITGIDKAAVIQVEANAASSDGVISNLSTKSTLADADSNFELAFSGYAADGRFAVILASKELEYSSLDSSGTVVARFSFTLNGKSDVDFEKYFKFETDSDLTFVQADYNEDKVYALSKSAGESYPVELLSSDVTPKLDNDIVLSGRVYISLDEYGLSGRCGARGIRFKVNGEYLTDSNGNPLTTSSEDGHYGEFAVSVPSGTTSLTLTGDSTVDRTIDLTKCKDLNNLSFYVVYCDYNRDGSVSNADMSIFLSAKEREAGALYDLNADGSVNNSDFTLFKTFLNKTIRYQETTQ